jgi:hypothetical protein
MQEFLSAVSVLFLPWRLQPSVAHCLVTCTVYRIRMRTYKEADAKTLGLGHQLLLEAMHESFLGYWVRWPGGWVGLKCFSVSFLTVVERSRDPGIVSP